MTTTGDQRNEDGRQPLHPPKKNLHAPITPKRRVPSNTFKKEATTTPLLPRVVLVFPSIREGGVGKGVPDALQEGSVTPAGVAALGLDKVEVIWRWSKKYKTFGTHLCFCNRSCVPKLRSFGGGRKNNRIPEGPFGLT